MLFSFQGAEPLNDGRSRYQNSVRTEPSNGRSSDDRKPVATDATQFYGSVTVQTGNTFSTDPKSSNMYGSFTQMTDTVHPQPRTPQSSDQQTKQMATLTGLASSNAELISSLETKVSQLTDEINFLRVELSNMKSVTDKVATHLNTIYWKIYRKLNFQ